MNKAETSGGKNRKMFMEVYDLNFWNTLNPMQMDRKANVTFVE